MGLVKKLFMKKGYRYTVINAPLGFNLPEEELPGELEFTADLAGILDFVLVFVHNQDELKQYVPQILPVLKEDALFWVAYPKKSSKIKTDISRDAGWEVLKESGFEGVSLISIDETWSAFRVRNRRYIKK